MEEIIMLVSLPPRGAWIEITPSGSRKTLFSSLPPRGAWIEILRQTGIGHGRPCRSPHGERGLK